MADPHGRLKKKLRYSPTCDDLGARTPACRAVDVFSGNQRYSEDLDMRSIGCLVAELYTRKVLFQPEPRGALGHPGGPPKDFAVFFREVLGAPGKEPGSGDFYNYKDQEPAPWLENLPFFEK
eukprot:2724137-Pyramimonas_sp.AAC.1